MTKIDHTKLAIQQMLANRSCREYLRTILLQHAPVLSSPHHPDPHAASYQAGRHAVGLLILGDLIEADPSAITLLTSTESDDDV